MSASALLTDADLHGLVDGHLEPGRRADVLRRLATSPADRARVDAWQDQNDLIRGAFFGIDKEALPGTLRLTAPPALHCVPNADIAIIANARPAPPARNSGRMIGGALLGLALAMALFIVWPMVEAAGPSRDIAVPSLRGRVDETLAGQASTAIAADQGTRDSATTAELPTTTIPDLSSAGFAFTSAEAPASEPRALVFHYRNAAADRIAVSVARASQTTAPSSPMRTGKGYSWHRGTETFAIAGTVRQDRLEALAALLQRAETDE